jgi:hypothetical protein
MSQKRALCIFGIVAALTCGPWAWYRWTFPYGYSHCCDSCLKFALDAYADKHGGVYPAGQATPEASLSLLFPKLAGAELLRGKTVPVEKVAKILTSGELLDEESCGWHYVEGLTQRDDRRLAIFWDKVGLGHHGQRLPHGGHTVIFWMANAAWFPPTNGRSFWKSKRSYWQAETRRRSRDNHC